MHGMMHGNESPSPWVRRWSHLVPPGAAVLDVACGSGRHLRWFRDLGHPVTGIDRAPEAVAAAKDLGEALQADLEGGPWPLPGRRFGGVVVTNYLWRPLFPALRESVAAGGVLICETFASGNETVGRPARTSRRASCSGSPPSALRTTSRRDTFSPSRIRAAARAAAGNGWVESAFPSRTRT
jgi:SAM-dependent methyltransferase